MSNWYHVVQEINESHAQELLLMCKQRNGSYWKTMIAKIIRITDNGFIVKCVRREYSFKHRYCCEFDKYEIPFVYEDKEGLTLKEKIYQTIQNDISIMTRILNTVWGQASDDPIWNNRVQNSVWND